jgi:hypothetical protein
MKKLFLILLLSIGLTSVSSAESVNVKYQGRISLDGFYCEYTSSSLVDRICYYQQNKYVVVSLNGTYYQYCGVPFSTVNNWLNSNSKGRFYNSYIKGRFDCRYSSNLNIGDLGAKNAYESSALLVDGLFGIVEALADSSNKSKSNSRRFYEKGTTWQWNGSSGYGTDGLQCNLKDDYYFLSCNNNVSYYICQIDNVRRTCGTDGTYYTSNWAGDDTYYCLESNFGSRCCGSQSKKTCR